ncbi:tetratricopeptide repeat protein [Nocardia concava]|uniref:tetratricopeptide repeat protein n=1 Tax=Nocardia concava TaxID=257281 RepID=UPI0002E73610|nr:tetratricopeptide repeat protein [Nocardia concava]
MSPAELSDESAQPISPRALFAARFSGLFAAAGQPTLRSVVDKANARMHAARAPGTVGKATVQRVSDWRVGRGVPARFESLAPVLVTLLEMARRAGTPLPPDLTNLATWRALWKAAASSAAATTAVPHQLPRAITDFTGRDEIADRLSAQLIADSAAAVAVAVITGMGGIGKTTLAIRIAHRIRDRYPDGQLYIDLRGAGDNPAEPFTVIGDFLGDLGLGEGAIPDTPEARTAALRGALDGKRVLLVLDNAAGAAQIEPLLPGSAGSAVIVTSRMSLPRIDGAATTQLAGLTPSEAATLFGRIVGKERAAAEPAAVERIVGHCGLLPLAIRIAAARLADRPGWTIESMADRLADEQRRLSALRAGEFTVEAAFQLSYDQLDADHRRAFERLAAPECEDFPLDGAAAVLGASLDDTEDSCETLVNLGLLETTSPGRYRFHDLVRLFASRRSGDATAEIVGCLLDYYLATMKALNVTVNPGTTLPGELTPTRSTGTVFPDLTAAYLWFYAERRNLLALGRQAARLGGHALDLMADIALTTTESGEGPHIPDLLAAMTTVLDAAIRTGNRPAQQRIRIALGVGLALTCMRQRLSREHLARAFSDAGPAPGPRLAGAAAVASLGLCWLDESAAEVSRRYRECLRYADVTGDLLIEVATHYFAGHSFLWIGDAERAREAAYRTIAVAKPTGMRYFHAGALSLLGSVVFDAGSGSRADGVDLCVRGVELARESGSRAIVGWTLMMLSRAYLQAGDYQSAETTAREAVIAAEWSGHGVEARALLFLGSALAASGRVHEANFAFQQARAAIEGAEVALSGWELGSLPQGANRGVS